MAETITLDPTAVATGRTELALTSWVRVDGIDWGDAQFEAYMAEAERGSIPVDGRLPNRIVTVPLILRTVGATSFSTIRLNLQQKVALLQREGGWLLRQVGSTPLYADVVNASLHLSGSWLQANKSTDIEAVLTLECLPDFYGAEVTLSDHVETTNPELIFTETGITGNYPGRLRIVVDNDQATDQRGLIGGFRSRHYDSASTAALAYAATSLAALDTAVSAGGAVTHGTVATSWTPVLGTNMGGTQYLTHTGSYRVWASVAGAADGSDVACRFLWDVGDLTHPHENDPVTLPGKADAYLLNLGEIRLDEAPVGTHRWQGMIQAKGVDGNEAVSVKRLWFQPLDEGWWQLRAPLVVPSGLTAFTARDTFGHSAGALTGKTLPVGGTWATPASTDTDDFNASGSGTATRSVTTDTGSGGTGNIGRFVLAGTGTPSTVVVEVDARLEATMSSGARIFQGVHARLQDTDSVLVAGISLEGENPNQCIARLHINDVDLVEPVTLPWAVGVWKRIRLYVNAQGVCAMWVGTQSGTFPQSPTLVGYDSRLATGGSMASGRFGMYDHMQTGTSVQRTYDNFAAWVPAEDAVMFASQSMELRTDGYWREDSSGSAYGPVSYVIGRAPRLPVSGLESRTVQVFLKASRGDLDTIPDTAADDISARAYYRPSYLYVGE